MKANLLKKITSSALVTMNIEEKRNLDLENIDEKIEIEPFKKCQKDIVVNHLKIAV